MSNKDTTKQENMIALIRIMGDVFKHNLPIFSAAQEKFLEGDIEGFVETYNSVPLDQLQQMMAAHHIAYNNVFSRLESTEKLLNIVLKQLSNARDDAAIAECKKLADITLMTFNLLDKGTDPEKIRQMLSNQETKVFVNPQDIVKQ